jgi:hypothetical protein
MPYSNLTSVLDATALAPIMTAANAIQTSVTPHSINLTADEISKMYKMSINRQSLGVRTIQIATDNPTLVPSYANLAAARVDNDRFVNLLALEMKLKAITQGIEHARMASGSEVLLFVKAIYGALQGASEQNVPGASSLFAELQQYYDLPAAPDAGTVVTPVV